MKLFSIKAAVVFSLDEKLSLEENACDALFQQAAVKASSFILFSVQFVRSLKKRRMFRVFKV